MQFNMLESLVNPTCTGKMDGDGLREVDRAFMNERTIPATPLLGEIGAMTVEGDRAAITALLEASMRTDRTFVVGREDGKFTEEDGV